MGKLITVVPDKKNIEGSVEENEWLAICSLAGLTVVTTFVFPLISSFLIEPFLIQNYGQAAQLGQSNLIIMMMMLFLLVVLPLSILLPHRKHRHVPAYMGGRTTTSDMHFAGSLGISRQMELSNYYLDKYFGETKLRTIGIWICTAIIGVMLISAVFRGVAI